LLVHRSLFNGNATDARLEPQTGENLVQDRPADIVEAYVDPVGAKGKLGTDVLRLIVDYAVKSGSFLSQSHLAMPPAVPISLQP
jgi:hypothetical protein